MYKIRENADREKCILLIPAMLDAHFPLLKYAFYSKNYHPVILKNEKDCDSNNDIVVNGIKYHKKEENYFRYEPI